MKRIILMMIAMMISFSSFARKQRRYKISWNTCGWYKTEKMKRKLIAKGFVPKKMGDLEWLEGEFNGTDVQAFIVTNNNKVWRIMLADKQSCGMKPNIKIRFNILVSQFENNKRYTPLDKYTLSDEEDISYEMTGFTIKFMQHIIHKIQILKILTPKFKLQ